MGRILGYLGRICQFKNSLWKGVIFVALTAVAYIFLKLAFDPMDAAGLKLLKSFFSLFHPLGSLPQGTGFVFLIVLLYLLGRWLNYEEQNKRYFLYRLHNIKSIGWLFPAPKSFEFESCVFWVTKSDLRIGAYRGEAKGNGVIKKVVVELNPPPGIFGPLHLLDEKYVIRIKMPAGKLMTIVTTGATTLPNIADLEIIPWPGETKEEAWQRYCSFPD